MTSFVESIFFIFLYYIFVSVIRNGIDNIRELVVDNQNLIYSIAKKFRGDIEDLFQVGCIGLMKAY